MTHKDPQVLASNDSYKQECTHKSWLNGEYFLSPEDENKLQLESDQKNAFKLGWSMVHERKLIREDLPETNLVRSQKQDSRRADR